MPPFVVSQCTCEPSTLNAFQLIRLQHMLDRDASVAVANILAYA